MKVTDIVPQKEKVNKIINYVLSIKPTAREGYKVDGPGKINITGKELSEKFGYDFITDALEITIDYGIKAMNATHKVDEFWGDQIRVDIAAQKEDGSAMTRKELRPILREALDEYFKLISEEHRNFHQLK